MRRGIVLLLGAAMACAKAEAPPPPPPPAIDSAGVTQAAADLWTSFVAAEKAGNVDQVLSHYAEQARLDVQGMPAMLGRSALDSVIRPVFATRTITELQISPHTTVVVSNDQVLQAGTFVETYVENKKAMMEYGRLANSIVRGADGRWQIGYLMAIVDSIVAGR